MFDDLLAANERYQAKFHDPGVAGRAARGLAVLTCIDSRIDPLAMLGLKPGDAKIIRNAGARATPDAVRSLILASNLLGVTRLCLVQHTDCAMVGRTEEDLRAKIGDMRGADASGWTFMTTLDQVTAMKEDVDLLRSCPLLPDDLEIGCFVFDVRSGALQPAFN